MVLISGAICAGEEEFRYDETRSGFLYADQITVEEHAPEDLLSIRELPAFVTVIRLDPEAARFRTLPEVLAETVGVTIRDFGGLGSLSTVSVRGSSASQVLVLLDGIPLNTSQGGGVDLSHISLDSVERIEVLRGADSAVFGDGAIGGVINLVTRKFSVASLLSAHFSYGSLDTACSSLEFHRQFGMHSMKLHLHANRSSGNFEFRNDNGTAYNDQDDYDDTRLNNAFWSSGGSFWWKCHVRENWNITTSLEGVYADKEIPGIVTFPSRHAFQVDRRISGQVRLDGWNLGSLLDDFNLTAHWIYSGLEFDDPEGEQIGVPVHTRQRDTAFGASSYFRKATGAGRFEFGLHGEQERLQDRQFDSPDRAGWAATCKHDIGFWGARFQVSSLLRYDHISLGTARWSPKFGLRWRFTDSLSFKANAGGAFRAPSFNELYMNLGFITGNEDLEPETGSTLDAGLVFENRRGRLSAAIFEMNTRNLIRYILVSGFRYRPVNIGKAQSRGIECETAWNLWRQLNVSSSYTWLQARDRSGDPAYHKKIIPGQPQHDWFSRITWQGARWQPFLEWRYISGNYVTRANSRRLPVRQIGNAGIQYQFSRSFEVGIEVKNFTGNDVVDVQGFPLPGRSLTVNTAFRF